MSKASKGLRQLNNFTPIESVYGSFVINRNCFYQAESLIKTGVPHIQSELDQLLKVIKTLPDGAVAIDAGANAGLVAVPMALALAGKAGVVHAFEVQRMMYYALCGTVALNDLTNLYVHHAGLGAKESTLRITRPDYSHAEDFGSYSLVDQQAGDVYEDVAIKTIDSLDLPRLDFLKIDVEGMEIDVLRGAKNTIKKHKPWCWIEFWKVDLEDIKKQLEPHGYEFFKMDQLNILAAPTHRLKESGLRLRRPHAE